MMKDKQTTEGQQRELQPTLNRETTMSTSAGEMDAPCAAQQHRRRLLRAVTAAGLGGTATLPTQWSRPLVDAVLLPAHAQATPVVSQPACNITCTSEATGLVFLSSNAIDYIENTFVAQCISENGDTSVSSAVFTYSATGTGGQGSAYSEFLLSTGTFSTFATLQDVYGTDTTQFILTTYSGLTTTVAPC